MAVPVGYSLPPVGHSDLFPGDLTAGLVSGAVAGT
jgi:hypothetical protein